MWLMVVLWCQAYDINLAASSAVATNAAATSAYALAVEKLVAGRIDTDTAGEQDLYGLSVLSRQFLCMLPL